MVEQAFDDQCTGANPRYPLMSEIKQMYLNAYYGKETFREMQTPDETQIKPVVEEGDFKRVYRKSKKA